MAKKRRERHDHHVAVLHVGELVRQHALELGRAEELRGCRVVAQTVAVFGERPIANAFGIWVSAIATLRLGQVGLHAQALDHRVQLGRLVRA